MRHPACVLVGALITVAHLVVSPTSPGAGERRLKYDDALDAAIRAGKRPKSINVSVDVFIMLKSGMELDCDYLCLHSPDQMKGMTADDIALLQDWVKTGGVIVLAGDGARSCGLFGLHYVGHVNVGYTKRTFEHFMRDRYVLKNHPVNLGCKGTVFYSTRRYSYDQRSHYYDFHVVRCPRGEAERIVEPGRQYWDGFICGRTRFGRGCVYVVPHTRGGGAAIWRVNLYNWMLRTKPAGNRQDESLAYAKPSVRTITPADVKLLGLPMGAKGVMLLDDYRGLVAGVAIYAISHRVCADEREFWAHWDPEVKSAQILVHYWRKADKGTWVRASRIVMLKEFAAPKKPYGGWLDDTDIDMPGLSDYKRKRTEYERQLIALARRAGKKEPEKLAEALKELQHNYQSYVSSAEFMKVKNAVRDAVCNDLL